MKELLSFAAFIATFISLYGLLNYYFYRKAAGCISCKSWGKALPAAFLLLMVFAPFLVNFASAAGLHNVALVSAWIGYTWMAAVFLFFCVHAAVDIVSVVRWIFLRISGRSRAVFERRRAVFAISAAMVSAALAWGFLEARTIRIEHVGIYSDKLSEPVRIAHLSDLHFGVMNGERFAAKVARLLEEINADIVVSTGDMIDRGLADFEGTAAVLRGVTAAAGKYAVAGNHEFYTGIEKSAEFHEKSGFTFLRNSAVFVSDRLTIAGVDDPAGRRYGINPDFFERRLLDGVPPERFTLLLKHQPVPAAGYDLQLSGHTHGGQIFPFNFIVGMVYPRVRGFHELECGCSMYISRGTGFWGPPLRLFAPPEITVIEIRPEES
ncbi:MAG TPA: metallophosphoesterase [Desulfobacteraceae bacterium]|nr:metallophosphoesterase [Desulfobacteraceae bacterium]